MLLLLACTPQDLGGDDSSAATDDTGTATTGPQPAPLATLSNGECPDTSKKVSTFMSGGEEREVHILLPDGDTTGAPLVFYWYPLGGSARMMISYLGLDDWAVETGSVVVVPTAREGNLFEWDFWTNDTYDLTLYDDVRTCLAQDLGIDLTRVSSTGMSAGGLWTTKLTMERADTLATSLVMSGGVNDDFLPYETPAQPLPVMLMYGGESDIYSAGGLELHFDQQTQAFATDLAADGSFVVLCDHEGGHTIPPEGRDAMTAWLPAHVYGEPSPFEAGLQGLPDYCATFTGD